MKYLGQLKALLKVTGKTQTELANLLKVSFPTLNSWLNEKSVPRQKARERIELLYQEYTGVKEVDTPLLQNKKNEITRMKRKYLNPLKEIITRSDLYDIFVLELTYHTNSIEGSTLNEPEVRAVIFDDVTVPNKSVIEHQEAKNHQAALGFLFNEIMNSKAKITENDIKKLHSILMNGIWPNAGQYRNHAVRIAGSTVVIANYAKVEQLMKSFVTELNKSPANIYDHLARTHAQFEQIHPFPDGNGRVGRLLLHFIALRHGLPPVLVKSEKKQAYYTYLERAQTKDEYIFLESFICDGLLAAFKLIG